MLLTLLHLKPQTDSSFPSLPLSLLREAESVPSPGTHMGCIGSPERVIKLIWPRVRFGRGVFRSIEHTLVGENYVKMTELEIGR